MSVTTRTMALLGGSCLLVLGVHAARAGGRSAAGSAAVVRLLDDARLTSEPVAGLSLKLPGDASTHFYVRSKGRWICASAYKVPCDSARLEQFLAALIGARGLVRSESREEQADFGLLPAGLLSIALHGRAMLEREDRDVVAALELTYAPRDPEESNHAFARRPLDPRTIETGFEPHAYLSQEHEHFPPFVDVRLLSQDFLTAGEAIEKVQRIRRGASDFELVRTPREVPPGSVGLDSVPFTWTLVDANGAQTVDPMLAEAYATFLLQVPFAGLDDPRKRPGLFESPAQERLVLFTTAGRQATLELGPALEAGPSGAARAVYVFNPTTNVLAVVESQIEALLGPRADAFRAASKENPWDEWLRLNLAQTAVGAAGGKGPVFSR